MTLLLLNAQTFAKLQLKKHLNLVCCTWRSKVLNVTEWGAKKDFSCLEAVELSEPIQSFFPN